MISPIRILQIFGRMTYGGAEMRTLEVMRHVDRQRFQIDFCALSGLPGELDDEVRKLGGRVHLLPLDGTFPWRFKTLLKEFDYQVIHSNVHFSSGLMLGFAAWAGVKGRIAHFRSTTDGRPVTMRRFLQYGVMRRWINSYATDILAVSRGVMEAAWPNWHQDNRCRIIYNGFDLMPFQIRTEIRQTRLDLGIDSHDKVFLHVGRFDPPKNHQRLISIFAEVLHHEPKSRLLLVGRGGNEIERKTRQCVADMGIEKQVIFAGIRTDIAAIMQMADVFLFPSLWEGLPGVVLEARAAGLPVLASDLPGVREIAGYLSDIAILSLSQPDEQWAVQAVQLCRSPKVLADFAGTPFAIESAIKALVNVWERAAGL